MRQLKLLALLFMLVSNVAFGHQDFWRIKDFGNVKVRIKTGFQYEEIKKVWIIGELAMRLCQKLKYKAPIFIDFNHHYVGNCKPNYFVSFDNGSITEKWDIDKAKAFLKQNSIVIRGVSREFTPSITLNLLEYSIINLQEVRATQKIIDYNQNYCQWKIKSIDTLNVEKIGSGNISTVIKDILKEKIYRQEDESNKYKCDISYYFQNNKYHIFYNEYKVKDFVLLVLDDIYQFDNISSNESIAFDTDSSFFFIQGFNNPHASKKKQIDHVFDNYVPFEVNKVGSYKVAISFWYYDNSDLKEKIVLYKTNEDLLIQDLDKEL